MLHETSIEAAASVEQPYLYFAEYVVFDDGKRQWRGPQYPKLTAKVEKFRAAAKRGDPTPGYGAAVLEAIRADNKARQNRAAAEPQRACPCASGTWHSEAKDILAAVNAQNITRCWNANAAKQARSDEEIIAQYHAHMKKQRAIQELI